MLTKFTVSRNDSEYMDVCVCLEKAGHQGLMSDKSVNNQRIVMTQNICILIR